MNRKLRRDLGQEIAERMVREMASDQRTETPEPASSVDVLLQQLATSVVGLLREAGSRQPTTDPGFEARLQKAERRLAKLASVEGDDDDDGPDGSWEGTPNLKYAKPKYKDVESVLKYVEDEGCGGSIKLVIMNFND